MNRCILTNASFHFWKNESLNLKRTPTVFSDYKHPVISQQFCLSSRIQTVPEWAVTEENNSNG